MKILMAPVNIAGQPIALTSELRRQGVDVSLLQYTTSDEGHAFRYPGDRFVNLKGKHRVSAQAETLEGALNAGYDIFHFWMSTLFGGRRYSNMYGLDLPFIKARGRRIIYRGTGFDLRVKATHMERNPYHAFQHGYVLDVDEDAQKQYIDYLKSYVDLFIVQDPEMHEFMPEARVVPRGIDVDAVEPVGIQPNDRPLVVHAPSKTLVKGTPLILQALKELGEEGLDFDLKVITGMAHQEAMGWYRRADLIIDQVLIGWYGVLTMEALTLGKPVVVYVREDLYDKFNPRIPIANANPDTLKDVLRPLLADYEARRRLAESGPDFVREVHDIRTVAARIKDIYQEVMEMPIRYPDSYADLRHFVAQFKDVEALDQRRAQLFKARKYEELLEEMPKLRFRANKYDELLREVTALRRRVRELEGHSASLAPPEHADAESLANAGAMPENELSIDRGILRGVRPRRRVRDREAHAELEKHDPEVGGEPSIDTGAGPDNEQVNIDRGILRSLRAKASEFDQLSDELPRLRFQARRSEELFEEVKSLRYKSATFDALRDEVLTLRFKIKQYEGDAGSARKG